VVVACDLKLVPNIFDTLENPQIIFEVLSKSTAYRDKTEKRMDYLDLESLTDYVIVHQDEMRVEHYERVSQKEWTLRIYDQASQVINLNSIDCSLSLGEIYQNVEFSTNLKLIKSNKK
jgi:Uma2 family endonuclease